MQLNRPLLVTVLCGTIGSVALAGPRDPKVAVGRPVGKAAKQLQLNTAARFIEPVTIQKVRRMADGRVVALSAKMPYTPPAGGANDAPTINAFDICQFDASTGAPVGGECAGAGALASSRWWFGTAALNAHCANDFVMDASGVGKPIDRLDFAWAWGVGALRTMDIGVFIADTFSTCAVGVPATAGPVDGFVFGFADDAGGAGYYYTNIGLPPDPALAMLAPADGNGAYEFAYGAYDDVTEIFTLDATLGTQPMMWDTNSPTMLGTQTREQWDDDAPQDGLFGVGECYNYGPYAIPCPPSGIIGAMAAFWVDPAGGGGCYANCDESTGTPVLTANDFQCFLNAFAAGSALACPAQVTDYANCDESTGCPALTANDFQCFLNAVAAGCP